MLISKDVAITAVVICIVILGISALNFVIIKTPMGLPPLPNENAYSDNDGWSDFQELIFGSDPNNADTDGDGIPDDLDPDPLTIVSLEVVESAPQGTSLENQDIRNTAVVWEELIEQAEETIDIETFYMIKYTYGPLVSVYNAIEDAAARGVKVRILIDANEYEDDGVRRQIDHFNSLPNIETRTLDIQALGGDYLHCKYFVVDHKVAFVGSANWSYSAMWNNREVGVVVHSKSVSEALEMIFETDWIQSGGGVWGSFPGDRDGDWLPDEYERWLGTDLASADMDNDGASDFIDPNPFVHLGSSTNQDVEWIYPAETCPEVLDNPGIADTEQTVVEMIESAENRIRLQTFTYTTSYGYTILDNALREAAARGIDVKIIIDEEYYDSHPEIDNLAAVPNIDIKIIDLTKIGSDYSNSHAKYLIIDGEKA